MSLPLTCTPFVIPQPVIQFPYLLPITFPIHASSKQLLSVSILHHLCLTTTYVPLQTFTTSLPSSPNTFIHASIPPLSSNISHALNLSFMSSSLNTFPLLPLLCALNTSVHAGITYSSAASSPLPPRHQTSLPSPAPCLLLFCLFYSLLLHLHSCLLFLFLTSSPLPSHFCSCRVSAVSLSFTGDGVGRL